MPRYVLLSPRLKPRLRVLRPRATYVFGRDPLADVRLPSEAVSRRHAELEWTMTNGFVIRDRRSTNGTRVNGVPVIQPRLLKDGDEIGIGPFKLVFRVYTGDLAPIADGGDDDRAATVTSDDIAALAAGEAAPAGGHGFAGNFAGQELLELCRVIALAEKDGVLTVWGEKLQGQLAFARGEIRRARSDAEKGGAGSEAAHAILAIPAGRFEFAAGPCGLEPNCRLKAEPLIMEVARRLDHAAPAPLEGGAAALDAEAPDDGSVDPFNSTDRVTPPPGEEAEPPLADANPLADENPYAGEGAPGA
ncbi:MAG TPA: FHA domain-containing protein [Planctomycetota bacterium]|nr:FHA domain-containing protein [Planctomycetota bacterium]